MQKSLFPHENVAGHRFVIGKTDGGLVGASDGVEEGQVEPVGPDHRRLVRVLLVEDVVVDHGVALTPGVRVSQVAKGGKTGIKPGGQGCLDLLECVRHHLLHRVVRSVPL